MTESTFVEGTHLLDVGSASSGHLPDCHLCNLLRVAGRCFFVDELAEGIKHTELALICLQFPGLVEMVLLVEHSISGSLDNQAQERVLDLVGELALEEGTLLPELNLGEGGGEELLDPLACLDVIGWGFTNGSGEGKAGEVLLHQVLATDLDNDRSITFLRG